MTDTTLHSLLNAVSPADEKEAADLAVMKNFAVTLPQPFSRAQQPAHFTGSAAVVTPDGAQVCMLLHGKLKRWLQPGGHADERDGGSLLETALREAREETGCDVTPHAYAVSPLDVDVHVIPARPGEPEHRHLDVRFLLVANNPEALRFDPGESSGARWLTWEDALALADEAPLLRLLQKAARQSR